MKSDVETWADRSAPTLDDFEAMARQAFGALPERFRALVGDITFAVSEFAEDKVLDGLFEGVGMAHAAASPATGTMPNRIWLYRRAILDYWAEHEETLGAVVTHVLVHEIGHHFGLSDDDMEAIEMAE